jgi:hypothetical protein
MEWANTAESIEKKLKEKAKSVMENIMPKQTSFMGLLSLINIREIQKNL